MSADVAAAEGGEAGQGEGGGDRGQPDDRGDGEVAAGQAWGVAVRAEVDHPLRQVEDLAELADQQEHAVQGPAAGDELWREAAQDDDQRGDQPDRRQLYGGRAEHPRHLATHVAERRTTRDARAESGDQDQYAGPE